MAPPGQDSFQYALSSNNAWAGYKSHQNPEFFPKLAAGQAPKFLWIGCSDARCPETTILGLQPGDLFVHRNVTNIVSATDINMTAVIEYAVAHLKVKHVVLCGHTECGAAAAALTDARVGGVMDTWLTPLRVLRDAHRRELFEGDLRDDKARTSRLGELNVLSGVRTLMANPIVTDAIRERGMQVHGTMFDIGTGRIKDLKCGAGPREVIRGAYAQLVFGRDSQGGAGMTPIASSGAHFEKNVVRGSHAQLVFRGKGEGVKMAAR